MATLEKIRSKSVLLFIIIIVALLAFILGDFLTSGKSYFTDPTTVAKADGVKVDYNDYNNAANELSNRAQQSGGEVNYDAVQSQALQAVLTRNLMDREYRRLGITVTDAELGRALYGDNATPEAMQTVAYLSQALGLATPDAAAVRAAIENPAMYNLSAADADQMRTIMASLEQNTTEALMATKFQRLIGGLFTYNKLDAQSLYDDMAATRQISYAVLPNEALAADSIEVTDAEVREYYNGRRETYALAEPLKAVSYILVPIVPSTADKAAADAIVSEAIEALKVTPGTQAVVANPRFQTTTSRTTAGQIRLSQLRTFVTETAVPGDAALITRTGDEYTIAKLIGKDTGIDSINVTMIQAAPGVDLEPIVAALNAGTAPTSLASDSVMVRDDMWATLEDPSVPERLHDALATAAIGNAFIYSENVGGQDMQMIYRVNQRHAPVDYYEYAVINYTVDPSNETLADLTGSLRNYIGNNANAQAFSANAAEAGYNVLTDQVGASSVQVGRAAGSRQFVKWVKEADKGDVSPVFQDSKGTYLIAIAVDDEYSDYLPYNAPAIYPMLESAALAQKKAHILAQRHAGAATDLAGYAAAFNTEVRNGSVNINNPFLLTIGMGESELMGAITAAEEGALVGPVEGSHGILVFQVDAIDTANRPMVEADYGQQFMRSFSPLRTQSPLPLLLGRHKVDNRSLNYVSNPAD